jgi:pyruvate/2-oxoglutarate/acetoin dehydrogenase E1 component
VRVPLVIRAPMGGRRGYGPTHSQTLEKLYLGVPGLVILAPSNLDDPGSLLERTILSTQDPVLFVENKLLYLLPMLDEDILKEFDLALGETLTLTLHDAPPPAITITAYGYMAELARQAILRLAYEQEVFAELIVPSRLSPFDIATLLASLQRTKKLLTVEEGTYSLGWGAEVLARVAESPEISILAAQRLAARDLPIPASGPLEDTVLPGVEDIIQAAMKLARK